MVSNSNAQYSYLEQLHPFSVCGSALVFLTSKVSCLCFLDLIHKTKTGTANVGRLLIPTHLDQSNNLGNHQQVLDFPMPFASLSILCRNRFAEPNRHVLTLLHPKFVVQCTGGVALMISHIGVMYS
jgi:hypothetical protein